MSTHRSIVTVFACLLVGCAGGNVGDGSAATEESSLSGWSSSLSYFFVSAVPADHQGGPLALRKANAVPGGVQGSTYGLAVLPYLSAADAKTQPAVDQLLAVPYAGNEGQVIALVGAKDDTSLAQLPAMKVYEVYLPSQPVAVADVEQRYALFERPGSTLVLVNEGNLPSGTTTIDYSGTVDPAAAQSAVAAGGFFSGSSDLSCSRFLWWLTCHTPTTLKVGAVYNRID
jgi:hypothetical protein